ncbi:MAG: hypothetical protein AAGG38_04910 [Planctomycetota bacterium]
MTDKEAAEWEKVRSKGKSKFTMMGALNLGLLLGLGCAVGVYYLWASLAPADWSLRVRWVLMWGCILGVPNLVYLFSNRMWNMQERRYEQRQSSEVT